MKIINYFIRRKKILSLKKKLARAEFHFIEAKIKAIESEKEVTINISNDELRPDLEAFMLTLLEGIQLRVNADPGEFLLSKLPILKQQFQNPILIAIDRIKNFFRKGAI